MWVPLGLAVAAGYILTRPSFNTRHISWQEFRVNYLEKGEVERLEVVNKNVVRVFLRRDAGGGVGVSANLILLPLFDSLVFMVLGGNFYYLFIH